MRLIHGHCGKILSFLTLMTFMAVLAANVGASELPERKQTKLGLYVTAKEAFEKWEGDPDNVALIDVRTTEEHIFIGHPGMAWNIPAFVQTYEWDPANKHFKLIPNPDFVSQVKGLFQPADTIMVMCRSGDRSAMATDMLAAAGFTQVFNIVDGMEGDFVTDTDSLYEGKRLKNGWINSGVPWTYNLDQERILTPKTD